ncbi:MAG: sugar nucleotide-binding protein [bacterium]|nr:sugar nucleotide-binding protein [bacterium]
MKILLFGASGMVGCELAHALAHHSIVAPPHTQVDIADAVAVERVVEEEKPDFIINAAAIIDVGALERDPALGARINVQGAENIARAAVAHAIPQLLVSSSYVFGESLQPYSEDAVKNPQNVYGRTKAEAEDALVACVSSTSWHVARSSWLYSHYKNTFVDEVAQTLLQGKPFEASPQRGNSTHCGEFAAAIVKNFIDASSHSGVYHIVNEDGASRFEIAREVARTLGASEDLVVAKEFPSSAMRPSVVLLNTKLPKLAPWEESLRTYIVAQYMQK